VIPELTLVEICLLSVDGVAGVLSGCGADSDVLAILLVSGAEWGLLSNDRFCDFGVDMLLHMRERKSAVLFIQMLQAIDYKLY
jgi:hypothetical protein